MLGNMINVQIDRGIYNTGSYCGRPYTVYSGSSFEEGVGKSQKNIVLHNVLVFCPDSPIDRNSVRVRVMAVTELDGRIFYISAEDDNILYEPLIREVMVNRPDFAPSHITCLYEKS